jgi:hypothetical protein
VVRLQALRRQLTLAQPVRQLVADDLHRAPVFLRVALVVEQWPIRSSPHEVDKPLLDDLVMQRHVAKVAGLDGPGVRRDAQHPSSVDLANILLSQLDNLADAGAREGADQRHPSLHAHRLLALAHATSAIWRRLVGP